MNPVEQQLARLERSAQEFADCIRALPEERFLQRMEGWTWAPRDVLAHLIGWVRLTVEGGEQVRRGQLPSYFADPGEDWSHVNAVLVQTYASSDREELLAELEAALADLARFLLALEPAEWDRDFGVRYKGYTVTIQNSVEALVEDFTDHQRHISDLSQGCAL